LGGYPVGRDWWGGKRVEGGMSEDNDRCFSTLVLGAFSTGVFQHHSMTWRCGGEELPEGSKRESKLSL
jgi:hypothetical protein